MSDDVKAAEWKPPYVPYATLTGFIDKKLGSGVLPPRIDPGFLDNYAGSVRPQLMSTLQTIGLIGENGSIEANLKRAAANADERKNVLRAWAKDFYAPQIELANENATAQMLHESFAKSGYKGSTLRKAIVFYLSLTDDLELPKSQFFKPPKQTGQTRTRAAKRTSKEVSDEAPQQETPAAVAKGEKKVIRVGDAGTVTMFVDVRWLDLDDEQFTNLRKAIRDLEALDYPEVEQISDAEDDEVVDDDEGEEDTP